MQFIALGQEWPLNSYETLFKEAVAFEPTYTFYYNNKVVFLLPRWYGKEGDWQRFASESADKLGGETGDVLYARIGWRVHERGVYDGFLKDSGYSWPRIKKGLEAIVKSYPDSISAATELAYLSWQRQDKVSAKAMFNNIGMRMDTGIWGDDKERFMRARSWALSP